MLKNRAVKFKCSIYNKGRKLFKPNILCFIFLFFLTITNIASAEKIDSYVTDNANIFSMETRDSLELALIELESKSNGVQVVVFTEDNIPQGMTLEERSLSLAEENGIGKKGNDNGVLFYFAKIDRSYRWEVGYGMESTLNSAYLGRISRDYMVPYFKQGNYELGILKGLSEIETRILNSNDSDVINQNLNNASNNSSYNYSKTISVILFLLGGGFFTLIGFVILIIIMRAIFLSITKNQPKKNNGVFKSAASSIFSSGGFRRGGGGFGGFGGGGFRGGGGHFGGGGHSGRF